MVDEGLNSGWTDDSVEDVFEQVAAKKAGLEWPEKRSVRPRVRNYSIGSHMIIYRVGADADVEIVAI
ncbi:MAG: type II toxin-antitoxin system RelE/ParE family toxin, partial [Pseudomonadota bacterium]